MGYEQGAPVYGFQAALPSCATASSQIPLTYWRDDLNCCSGGSAFLIIYYYLGSHCLIVINLVVLPSSMMSILQQVL